MAIDEKKLIEDIEKEFDGVCVYDVSPSQVVADFVEIVDRQPKVGEWIPCSERLPEVHEDTKSSEVVLVCGYDKQIDFSWQAMGFYVKTKAIKRWFFAECNDADVPIDWIDITAWMPLPEPYKGE